MSKQQYYDRDGNPVTLDKLCRLEPEWAANRIRVMTGELKSHAPLTDT